MRCSAKGLPLAASGPPDCPKAPALSHFRRAPGRVFAFHPKSVLPDSNRRLSLLRRLLYPTKPKTRIPTPTCAPRSLRRLLSGEIQHADCLSPTGYSTERKDAGFSPEPRHSAHGRSLVRLALPCATRCPSRLTMWVSRIAPPRVLSRACIPDRAEAATSA